MSYADVKAAHAKALQNGWTEELIDEETILNGWECYKAIMAGIPFKEYRKIIGSGGSVRYVPTDPKGEKR